MFLVTFRALCVLVMGSGIGAGNDARAGNGTRAFQDYSAASVQMEGLGSGNAGALLKTIISRRFRRAVVQYLPPSNQFRVDAANGSGDDGKSPVILLKLATHNETISATPAAAAYASSCAYTITCTTTRTAGSTRRAVATVVGSGQDGLLAGVGRLLREFRVNRGEQTASLPSDWCFSHSDAQQLWPMRGHQLSSAHHTSVLKTWDEFETFTADLAVFGTTQFELAHINTVGGLSVSSATSAPHHSPTPTVSRPTTERLPTEALVNFSASGR